MFEKKKINETEFPFNIISNYSSQYSVYMFNGTSFHRMENLVVSFLWHWRIVIHYTNRFEFAAQKLSASKLKSFFFSFSIHLHCSIRLAGSGKLETENMENMFYKTFVCDSLIAIRAYGWKWNLGDFLCKFSFELLKKELWISDLCLVSNLWITIRNEAVSKSETMTPKIALLNG